MKIGHFPLNLVFSGSRKAIVWVERTISGVPRPQYSRERLSVLMLSFGATGCFCGFSHQIFFNSFPWAEEPRKSSRKSFAKSSKIIGHKSQKYFCRVARPRTFKKHCITRIKNTSKVLFNYCFPFPFLSKNSVMITCLISFRVSCIQIVHCRHRIGQIPLLLN